MMAMKSIDIVHLELCIPIEALKPFLKCADHQPQIKFANHYGLFEIIVETMFITDAFIMTTLQPTIRIMGGDDDK